MGVKLLKGLPILGTYGLCQVYNDWILTTLAIRSAGRGSGVGRVAAAQSPARWGGLKEKERDTPGFYSRRTAKWEHQTHAVWHRHVIYDSARPFFPLSIPFSATLPADRQNQPSPGRGLEMQILYPAQIYWIWISGGGAQQSILIRPPAPH